MKSLGQLIETTTPEAQSTALVEARKEPITPANVTIKGKKEGRVMPVFDEKGNYQGDEFALVEDFSSIDATPQEIAAMNTPTSYQNTIYHLTRLASHLRYSQGGAFEYYVEDLAADLNDFSEWAIYEACRWFRQNTGPFFPTTSQVIERVKMLDQQAKSLERNRNE